MLEAKPATITNDLREWMQVVEGIGELKVVRGADWNLEIGAISEANYRQHGPALLFDEIKDYQPGFRTLTGATGSARRLGATFGFGTDFDDRTIVEAFRGKPGEWERNAAKFPPRVVKDGPVLENVLEGNDVDITKFPAPLWHEHDAGRFLGTGDCVITVDPDQGWVNYGCARAMVLSRNETTLLALPGKHARQHYEAWWKREGRAPIAISLGQHPLLFCVSAVEVPGGISELGYAGAIRGEPIDVIRGEVTGLPFPAHAEIVLEGWIRPDHMAEEGYFGEWTGYYGGAEGLVPVFEIERVYHRNNPIVLGSPPGKPPHDFSYMRSVMKSAMIHDALVLAGVPGVTAVWAPESAGGRTIVVVAINQRFCGHSRQAGLLASQLRAGAYMGRWVIVVDDDIDPTNLDEVMWAVGTRADPETDVEVIRKAWGSVADPLNRSGQHAYNTRGIIDACRPYDWLDKFPRVAASSPERLREVRKKWPEIFGS